MMTGIDSPPCAVLRTLKGLGPEGVPARGCILTWEIYVVLILQQRKSSVKTKRYVVLVPFNTYSFFALGCDADLCKEERDQDITGKRGEIIHPLA
jgi:hypothetical protein